MRWTRKVLISTMYWCLIILIFIIVIVYKNLENLVAITTSASVEKFTGDIQRSHSTYKNNTSMHCLDRNPTYSVKARGHFYVFANFVGARKRFRCGESVTFATPADFRFLDNLPILVERWRGPVSVALYAPGSDFEKTVNSISYVSYCGGESSSFLVREYVTFHVFFEKNHMPKKITQLNTKINCSEPAPYNFYSNSDNSYKKSNNLSYPINAARNIAREESQTHFILTADIELLPTPFLIEKFLKMAARNPEIVHSKEPEVFVLPVFEILKTQRVPHNKTVLQEMYRNRKAQIFHKKLCLNCHKVPGFADWILAEDDGRLDVFLTVKRETKHEFWEPFYIGTNRDPFFDERLTWEGQSNKITQGYLMCLLDYKYSILDDAFLVHKPGIKKSKEQLKYYKKEIRKTNKIKRTILKEYNALFGNRTNCKMG